MNESKENKVVLIVDDEPELIRGLERLLKNRGFRVHVATSAADILNIINGGLEFDVLVSDMMMPGTSGDKLITALREKGLKQKMYLYTATPREVDCEHDGMFEKPNQQSELLKQLLS